MRILAARLLCTAQGASTWLVDHAACEGRRAHWAAELAAHERRREWQGRQAAATRRSAAATKLASSTRLLCVAARDSISRAAAAEALAASLSLDRALGAALESWRAGTAQATARLAAALDEQVHAAERCGIAVSGLSVASEEAASAAERDAAMARFLLDRPGARLDALAGIRHSAELPLRRRLSALRDVRDAALLADARTSLRTMEELEGERTRLQRLREVGVPAFEAWEAVDAALTAANAEASRLDIAVGGLKSARDDGEAEELKVAELERFGAAMRDRLGTMKAVQRAFAAYRAGVYSTHVVRVIGREVNRTLALMQDGMVRQIRLVIRWRLPSAPTPKSKATCGAFDWYIRVGSDASPVPYHGASGFQKAAVGIAMRIALARIGGAGVASRALIIDEGFRDCDADNLARVPPFLNGLLRTSNYDNIILVSHITDIRDVATIRVPIVQTPAADGNQLSTVRFGVRPRPHM